MSTSSTDGRWAALAAQIADQLDVSTRSRVSVFVNDGAALPAAHALIRTVIGRGAAVQTVYTGEFADDLALAGYDPARLREPAPVERAAMEWSDVHVSFRAMLWPDSDRPPVADLPRKLAALRGAKGTISALRWRHTRWAVVRIPTPAWAAEIGISADTLLDDFFAGALDDWAAARIRWQPIADALTRGTEVRITAPDTDLTLGIAGRRGVLFAGEANLPDGEAATAPVDDQVSGHITFPGRAVFGGEILEDLRLTFEHGRVTDVRATQGADVARALTRTDTNADRVGELGIGLSPHVKHLTGDLFIDEKILGTVHIALGRAYPECGGTNVSSLHWDIVKDLRPGAACGPGTLTIDGTPLINAGHLLPGTTTGSTPGHD